MTQTIIGRPIDQHNDMLDQIEALVDKGTVGGVLSLLAEVCSAKADHIRSNWQDEQTASVWEKMTEECLRAQDRILRLR